MCDTLGLIPRCRQHPGVNQVSTLPPKRNSQSVRFTQTILQKKSKSSGPSLAGTAESRPQTPLSEASGRQSALGRSPRLVRAGSRILDKLQFFEERRRSLELLAGQARPSDEGSTP